MSFVTKFVQDITGATAANKANKLSAESLSLDKQRYADEKSFQALLDQLLGTAKAGGAFDADSRVAAYDKEFNRGLDQTLQSTAAADRIAGAKPGDSTPGHRRDVITAQALSERSRAVDQIRLQSIMDELRARLSSRNPGLFNTGQALSSGYQTAANRYTQQSGQQLQGTVGLAGLF